MDVSELQQLNFPTTGAYHTSVTVRTDENILYSSYPAYDQTVNVLDNPETQSTSVAGIQTTVYDLEEDSDSIYALTANVIYKISKNNPDQLEEINLPPLTNPEGFAFDTERNIFIADTGSDRVIKLLASSNYQEDTTFVLNEGGSEDGQLLSPKDITISGRGNSLQVYVLDAGNNRVQIFNSKGKYRAKFDGSTTNDGKLNSPLNMINGSSPIITDFGNNMVRELSYNSQTKKEESKVIATISNMGKVTFSEQGQFIPDNNNKALLDISNQGDILRTIPMSKAIGIAIFYDQGHQLLYQEKGSNQLKHIFIPKTTPENAPLALSKKFVQAYLASDNKTILEFTSYNLLHNLRKPEVDVKAREAFTNLSDYRENIYMYGLKAVVEAKAQTSQGEVAITFDFVWQKGRWLLAMVR